MKPVLARIGRSLLIMSAVFCVLSLAMWVRTIACTECIEFNSSGRYTYVFSHQGRVILARVQGLADEIGWTYHQYGPKTRLVYDRAEAWERMWSYAGFSGGTDTARHQWCMAVPYWFVVLVTGTGPLVWFVKRRRQRARQIAGHCASCGYDLRASRGRCPECGTSIVRESKGAPIIVRDRA